MYAIGYDLGSSSIKAALIDDQGKTIASTSYPDYELAMDSPQIGWAEQHPDLWWQCTKEVTKKLLGLAKVDGKEIKAVGIGYQMHGLVVADKDLNILRPSIIWCDSRAVDTGNEIFGDVGARKSLSRLLNSPGNFTFSKLRWIQKNEPDIFEKIRWVMLPGDYLAMKMTGVPSTTISGLSEGTMWDFKDAKPADFLFQTYGIPLELLPEVKPTFSAQGQLTGTAAKELGLSTEAHVGYRAGDQPNNALSLGVLEPGQVAATGGTSGVVYGVQDVSVYDPKSRVNSFAHVNYTVDQPRTGVLLCINGSGIQYRWAKSISQGASYEEMEAQLSKIPIGSEGLSILPFGNGAERMLENQQIGGHLSNIDFNRHTSAHLYRASLEGIAFAFRYGMDILRSLGMPIHQLRVGNDNLFQSATFSRTVSNLCQAPIEIQKTTGAVGAARGAAYGLKYFDTLKEAVGSNQSLKTYEPNTQELEQTEVAYETWKEYLNQKLQ